MPFFPFRLEPLADGHSVTHPVSGRALELNAAAAVVARLCDGCRSWQEILDALCDAYQAPRDEIERKSIPVVERLSREHLLWWRAEPARAWHAGPPLAVLWDITSRCNLRCQHCVVSAGVELEREMPLATCVRLIDEFADFGVSQVILSGGEPMLHVTGRAADRMTFHLCRHDGGNQGRMGQIAPAAAGSASRWRPTRPGSLAPGPEDWRNSEPRPRSAWMGRVRRYTTASAAYPAAGSARCEASSTWSRRGFR